MHYRRFVPPLPILAALFFVGVANSAVADIVKLDNFSVTVGSTTIFNDTFSEGTTLNPGVSSSGINFFNGTPANYFVQGTITEAGGLATLDTANGALITSPPPFFPLIREASASLLTGLASTTKFSATGLYNLSLPTAVNSAYGIELIDLNAGSNGDIVGLRVSKGSSGNNLITFLKLDRIHAITTILGSVLLDAVHNQILLELSQQVASSDTISASYAYVDGGVEGALTTFGPTTTLFDDGGTLTRPTFDAFETVPETATLALFLSGLAGLGLLRPRKKRAAA